MPAAPGHCPESEFETIHVDYATGEFPATNNRAPRTRAASALHVTRASVFARNRATRSSEFDVLASHLVVTDLGRSLVASSGNPSSHGLKATRRSLPV